jgi:hypothetical protein
MFELHRNGSKKDLEWSFWDTCEQIEAYMIVAALSSGGRREIAI